MFGKIFHRVNVEQVCLAVLRWRWRLSGPLLPRVAVRTVRRVFLLFVALNNVSNSCRWPLAIQYHSRRWPLSSPIPGSRRWPLSFPYFEETRDCTF